MYLDRVRKAGVKMVVYERYVDDSNQIAKVSPPRSVYDTDTRNVVHSLDLPDTRNDDQRLAEVLKEIANEVMPGVVVMEEDVPSRKHDGKLAILDMKVWMGEDDYILHQHYEKDVASKKVLNASSAQSVSCKQSVHTMKLVRRMVNTSEKLDWNESMAPVLTDYMGRMYQAGYDESYRRRVLERALVPGWV